MTIQNVLNWLQEAEDNNCWQVSTQSVKRHLEEVQKQQLIITDVGCSLKNKQVPTFEEYLELCYIKLNHNYRSKETLQNYSLEEIEQRYTWMKNL